MTVQFHSTGISHQALPTTGKATAADTARVAATNARPSPPPATTYETAVRRGDFTPRQGNLNRAATHAQRSLAYVRQTLASLLEFKVALAGNVVNRATSPTQLEDKLSRLQAQWQSRQVATGGALGPDLGFHEDGQAKQKFHILALDVQALQNEHPEVLMIYPRGMGKPSLTMALDGKRRSENAWARQLDQVLASAGIQVTLDHDNELSFSIEERQWNELRYNLMIQGSGHRFPAGRPVRIAAVAAPASIDPASWKIEDIAGKHATLKQVAQAISQIQAVRSNLDQALANVSARIREDSGKDQTEMSGIAGTFDNVLQNTGDFPRLATIGATLRGLSEQRVRAAIGP